MQKILQLIFISVFLMITACVQRKDTSEQLSWSAYSYAKYDKFRKSQSKLFEKHWLDETGEKITIDYHPIPSKSFDEKILTMLAGGKAPDIYVVQNVSKYVQKDAIVDLTPFINEDKEYFAKFAPQVMEAVEYKGRYYTLPGNLNVANVLYYNKKIFDLMSIPVPDHSLTFQQLRNLVKKLTLRSPDGQIKHYGLVVSWPWEIRLALNGVKIFSKDNKKCLVNTAAARKVLDYWRKVANKDGSSPTQEKMSSEFGGSWASGKYFTQGKAAIYLGHSWEVATFIINKSQIEWDMFPCPHWQGQPQRSYLDYLPLAVNNKTADKEKAFALLKFMTRPKYMRFLIKAGDCIPLRKEGIAWQYYQNTSSRPEKSKKVLIDAVEISCGDPRSIVMHPDIPMGRTRTTISEVVTKFMMNEKMSSEKALLELEKKLNKLIRDYKK
ncbi:MAG TPA: extracellular solute-binding protein [Spirochaetota bacterium]|nr:extracellular solute-binding protein [Spirochaetota bacterium]